MLRPFRTGLCIVGVVVRTPILSSPADAIVVNFRRRDFPLKSRRGSYLYYMNESLVRGHKTAPI